MLTINDNITFKANLVTKLKGRDNVITQISKSFSQQSQGIKGSLLMERGRGEFKGAIVCKLKSVKNSPEYYIGDYNKYFALESNKVTSEMVNSIAKRLIKIMQILKQEHLFNIKNKELNSTIDNVTSTLNANKSILEQLRKNGKENVLLNTYKNLVKSNQARIESLKMQKQKVKDKLIKNADKIAGKEDPVLIEYIDILKDII